MTTGAGAATKAAAVGALMTMVCVGTGVAVITGTVVTGRTEAELHPRADAMYYSIRSDYYDTHEADNRQSVNNCFLDCCCVDDNLAHVFFAPEYLVASQSLFCFLFLCLWQLFCGNVRDPKDGIRGVVPGKREYWGDFLADAHRGFASRRVG